MRFTILQKNVLNLQAAFEKLNKKAEKYGTGELRFVCVDEPFLGTDKDEYLITGEYYQEIEVSGIIPIVGNFKLVAVLEQLEDGQNIIKSVPGENLPEEYRTNNFFCDHCKTNRYRKEVVIVRNNDKGEYVQLGKNCLKDYLGISLEHLVNRFSWLTELIENNSDPDYVGGGSILYSCNTKLFLATCSKIIRTIGFVSKKQSENGGLSTSVLASEVVFGTTSRTIIKIIEEYDLKNLEDCDYEMAEKAIQWIQSQDDSNNDYYYNLKIISRQDEISTKRFGFLASLIPAYQRYLGFEAEKKKKLETQKESNFVGWEKQRMVFENVECIFVKLLETYYGTSTMIKFIDDDGNNLVWFGSGCIEEYESGQKYTIKATVKKHDTYNGVKQTIINRVKLENVLV